MPNPIVFLDVSINKQTPKRITIQLYADSTPITAAKFHSLCTGNNIAKLHYRNSTFHRILRRPSDQNHQRLTTLCQGGTLPNAAKEEIECVYGIGTKAENFIKKHDGFGTVSMVSPRGPQFFILTDVSERNDGKYVVVGRVVDVVEDIANVGSFTGGVLASVVIVDCGVVRENLTSNISASSQKMSSKEFERVVSTSNKQLLNCLKKIMNVNKKLTEVDPEDVVLENENELVEIVGRMEDNLNVLFHLKPEVCALEKRQKQLFSQTRTKNSNPLRETIPKKTGTKAAFPDKLAETSAHNNVGLIPFPFVTLGRESQDFSDSSPITKKYPKKKKKKLALLANPVKTTPRKPAGQTVKKCSHSGTANTPQWRRGPLGPMTLCNACGMRNRSGWLLPKYRPAASPTFDPTVHSNSHRKAVEMRNQGMFRISSQHEHEISTSNEQLSNSLKEIIDVNTQSVAVDAKDVLVLESEKDLVEVSVVSEHNLNAMVGLKAGVCSLEKYQNELLSHTGTQVPSIKKKKWTIKMPKNKKIKLASLAKHVETLSLNSGREVVRKCFQCESPKTLDSEAPKPSSWGETVCGGTPNRGKGRTPASQKMSYKEFKQVISTSNRIGG